MMAVILEWMSTTRSKLSIPAKRCLEVGSLNVNGSPRVVFPDAVSYHGIDLVPGAGVDQVGDAEQVLALQILNSYDTVICCETLEHTVRPWSIVAKMKSILAPGGFLWVSTPTYGFPLHRFPLDCYRFGHDAYTHWLYADMTLLGIATVFDELGQPAIVAVGQKKPYLIAGGAAANVTTAPVD